MKKWLMIFAALLIVFVGVWVIKPKVPSYRPDAWSDTEPTPTEDWWQTARPTVDPKFVLDAEIPLNYIPVLGEDEVYMQIDEHGNVVKYRKREKQDNGEWVWSDIDLNIPKNFIKVEGFDDLYKSLQPDGTYRYYKYVRNKDNTYYFEEVQQDGSPMPTATPDANIIPDNYRRVTGNIYAVIDENGVIRGYKERKQNADGTYYWVDADEPTPESSPTPSASSVKPGKVTNPTSAPASPPSAPGGVVIVPGSSNKQPTEDGGYIETNVTTDTKEVGGYLITYQTTITMTFDKNGDLLKTNKKTEEISRVKVGDSGQAIADRTKIKGALEEELSRISSGVTYDADVAEQLLTAWNAERTMKNLTPLTMDDGKALKLAKLKAADMAIYNYAEYESYMYGTLADLAKRYQIESLAPTELCLKTTPKSGEDLCARFVLQSSDIMLSGNYTKVGIAVTRANGYMYTEIVILG